MMKLMNGNAMGLTCNTVVFQACSITRQSRVLKKEFRHMYVSKKDAV
jgi:hypothetical protein